MLRCYIVNTRNERKSPYARNGSIRETTDGMKNHLDAPAVGVCVRVCVYVCNKGRVLSAKRYAEKEEAEEQTEDLTSVSIIVIYGQSACYATWYNRAAELRKFCGRT